MKKFLSLVLALIMTMSLVTVSAGAKDFTDDDKLNYEEAVAVMSEIGVIDGYPDGSFKPQNGLTRGAAAKIICNMILGPTTASALRADTAPFKDVPADNQYAGYIAYCVQQGITAGYTDGTYRPAAPLTNFAFMKMLLGALGYDQNTEGYVGGNCFINVAKQAIGLGLNKGLLVDFDGGKQINREEAALFAFNTLKATVVEYPEKTTVNVGGAQVVLQGKAQDVEWGTATLNDGNIDRLGGDGFVQFAEKHFPKLVRTTDIDAFGRPANTWTFNKKDIGTYVNKDLLVATYTKGVKGGAIFSDIGSVAAKFALTYWENGIALDKDATKTEAAKLVKNDDHTMNHSGNGVLTEVYVDTDTDELTIVEVHTYLAQANADYNEKTEKLGLTVYYDVNGDELDPSEKTITRTVTLEDFPQIKDYEDDDVVLVTYAGEKKVIKSIADPEMVADVELTAYSVNGGDVDHQAYMMKSIKAAGETYNASYDSAWEAKYLYDYTLTELKDHTWNVYLDQYGYVLGLENVEASVNYAFLIGYESGSSYLAKAIDKALVITIDSEKKADLVTVEIRDDKMDGIGNADPTKDEHVELFGADNNAPKESAVNKWVTYEMDGDVMILKTCVDDQFQDTTTAKIDKENATLESGETVKYGNAASLYIAVDADYSVAPKVTDGDAVVGGSIVDINGQSIGIKNTSINIYDADVAGDEATKTEAGWTVDAQGAYVLYDNGYVKYAVVVGEDGSIADRLVYLTDDIAEKRYDKEANEYYYIYEGIVGGEINDEIISVVAKDTDDNYLAEGILYVASYDAEGNIVKMVAKEDNWFAANTVNNRDAKYVQATSGVQVDANPELAEPCKLNLKEQTLYITAESNNHYVILDDECVFYVNQSDDEGETDGYERFTSAKNALAALGNTTSFTGNFVAICDGTTGFATTVIINDSEFEVEEDTVETEPEPEADTYTVETLGCSAGSSNVQFVIKKNGTAMTAAELKALDLTANEIIVMNDGAQKLLNAAGTGTYYKKLGDTYVALQWSFADSPIAIFDIYAYDHGTIATTLYGANAGYVKAHLSAPLGDAGTSLAVYIDRDNFNTVARVVG